MGRSVIPLPDDGVAFTGDVFQRRTRPGSPRGTGAFAWKTFLRNHMEGIASIDLFVVPTIAFQQLFAFLVLGHRRRRRILAKYTTYYNEVRTHGSLGRVTPAAGAS